MIRILLWAVLMMAWLVAGASAQTWPGPASPSQARIYFYRTAEPYGVVRWTGVWLNDAKVGDLAEATYFARDVAPGTYKVGVTSDVPYSDQYETVTFSPGSTTFIRVFHVPGYGMQFNGGGLNSPPTFYAPTVFGNRVADPAIARQQMIGLKPAGG